MLEIPQFILERARIGDGVFSADEVSKWPPGLLDDLVANDVLQPEQPAKSVSCDACGEDHVEIVQYIESPPGSGLRGYIPCPQLGRVSVPMIRLRRWRVDMSMIVIEPAITSQNQSSIRCWPDPKQHTTAKIWTVKSGAFCLSTTTERKDDGKVEFALVYGKPTKQMQLMRLICFMHPKGIKVAKVIEQVYPEEIAEARRDADLLKGLLKKIRSLISDIRNKKLSPAGINPDILPPLDIEITGNTKIGLHIAHLHKLDDIGFEDLEWQYDKAPE